MPLSVQRAASVPRDFYDDALCRTDTGVVAAAWTVEPNQRVELHGEWVRGRVLNALALEVCRVCPVQWECATAAIQADEKAGVWGDTLDRLRKLHHDIEVIALAKSANVSVQDAVRGHLTDIS